MVGNHIRRSTLSLDLQAFMKVSGFIRFGFDVRKVQLSSLILTKQISREEA